MILVCKQGKVIATHDDAQIITFAIYSSADSITQIQQGIKVRPGNDDPTLARPELIINQTTIWGTPDVSGLFDAGYTSTRLPEQELL